MRLKLNTGTNKTSSKIRESLSLTVPVIDTGILKPLGRCTITLETFL